MPGPLVHLQLTARWAEEEGLSAAESVEVAIADTAVDALWPGRRHPARHFNPTAPLLFAPLYMRKALQLARKTSPEERSMALALLGFSLHCRQDSIGHGVLGLSHLRQRFGLLKRNPDVYETMSPRARARIEQVTRKTVRRFIAARA